MKVNIEHCACYEFDEIENGELFAEYCAPTVLFIRTSTNEAVEVGTGNVVKWSPTDLVLKVSELTARFT